MQSSGRYQPGVQLGAREWMTTISGKLGHSLTALIENHETALMDNKLLTPRTLPDGSGVSGAHARLTDLGLRFCKNIEAYYIEKQALTKGEVSAPDML